MSNALPRVWMPINGGRILYNYSTFIFVAFFIKYLKSVAIKICIDKIVAVKKGFTPVEGLLYCALNWQKFYC